MRKRYWACAVLALCLLLCFLLVGCSGAPRDALHEAAPTPTPLPVGEAATLELALFHGGFGETYWKEVIAAFQAKYPGVTVNYMIHPRIGDLIRPALLSGDAPDFLYHSDSSGDGVVVNLIQSHALGDLTDLFSQPGQEDGPPLSQQFITNILKNPCYAPYGDEHIYLAPFSYGPLGLFYNKTLFEKNGWSVPETWDDFFALGALVKQQGIALLTYPGLYSGYLESLIYPAIANSAGIEALERLFRLDGTVFDDPNVLAALEMIKRITDEGYLLEGTLDMSHLQSQAAFLKDQALFIPNGTWIQNEMYGAERTEGFTFSIAAVPVFHRGDPHYVQVSYEQLSIPANAKNPALAKEFLRFLYSDESLRLFAEHADGVLSLSQGLEAARPYLSPDIAEMYALLDSPNVRTYLNEFVNARASSPVSVNEVLLSSFANCVLKEGMSLADWCPLIQQQLTTLSRQ